MKGILHNEHPVNKDIFVHVPKNQFANNLLDKFQAVGLFSIDFLFIYFIF